VTAPSAYHEGWNGGANVVKAHQLWQLTQRGYQHYTGDSLHSLVIEWWCDVHNGENNTGVQQAAEPRSWSLNESANELWVQEEVRGRGRGFNAYS
jgi:hypothetical protein